MKEELITFETAKLAKERGFKFTYPDKLSSEYYEPNFMRYYYHRRSEKYTPLGDYYTDVNQNIQQYGGSGNPTVDAPTQALLQKWLREVHNIVVLPYLYDSAREDIFSFSIIRRINNLKSDTPYVGYEKALEIGLQESLKLIK